MRVADDFSAFGALFYSSWCKERGCTSHDLQYMCGSEGGEDRMISCKSHDDLSR